MELPLHRPRYNLSRVVKNETLRHLLRFGKAVGPFQDMLVVHIHSRGGFPVSQAAGLAPVTNRKSIGEDIGRREIDGVGFYQFDKKKWTKKKLVANGL